MQLGTRFRALALVSVGLFVAAACGGGGGGSTNAVLSSYHPVAGVQGGQLVYSDWESVQDLNPISSSAATTDQATGLIFAGLWQFDPQNNAIPDLVSEVPTVANGDVKIVDATHMDITIKLKSGLKWSDGQPLTTKDLHFTIDAICDPATGAVSQVGYQSIATIEDTSDTVEVWHFGPDPTGKRCGLSAPLASGIYAPYTSAFAGTFGGGAVVLPQHVLGTIKHADWATSDYFTKLPTVTEGPYMVQNFTPGPAAQVVMVPNPNYAAGRSGAPFFNHAPYLDKLIYKIYGDKPSQIAGLKSGDTDLGLDLIAKDLPSLTGISGYTTVTATGLLDEYLTFNVGKHPNGSPSVFNGDKPLRQAIALAIDKNQINTSLVGGIGKPMNGPFVSALSPYTDTSIPAWSRDVAKANSLLDSDGWTKAADGTRSKNGVKLAWVISTTSGNSQRAAEEEQLIKNWADIGATVTTKNWPAGQFFNDFKGGGINATGNYDMALYANNWSPDPDIFCTNVEIGQIPTAANPSGANWSQANDTKLDSLCLSGAQEVDINKRVAIYKQVQAEWKDFLPTIELYERPDVFSHASNFGNFAPMVNGCLAICNGADWFNTKGKS
jgi:peptide/nickel transport system substrate-binding protein